MLPPPRLGGQGAALRGYVDAVPDGRFVVGPWAMQVDIKLTLG